MSETTVSLIGKERFLESGQKVLVHVESLAGYVVQDLIHSGEDEFPSGRKYVVERVFAETPNKVYDERVLELDKKIQEKEALKKSLDAGIRALEKAHKEQSDRFKKTKGLELLEDYLNGKITHFMECHYGWKYSITEFKEEKPDGWGRTEMKLLVLFGNSKGDLTWRRDQYSDGSGGSRQEVIPCRSFEEARQEIQNRMDAIEWGKLQDHLLDSPIKTAAEFNLRIPNVAIQRLKAWNIKCLEEQIEKNRQAGEKIREEMQKAIDAVVA